MGWKNQSKERCERKLNGKWLQDDISIHQLAGITCAADFQPFHFPSAITFWP